MIPARTYPLCPKEPDHEYFAVSGYFGLSIGDVFLLFFVRTAFPHRCLYDLLGEARAPKSDYRAEAAVSVVGESIAENGGLPTRA